MDCMRFEHGMLMAQVADVFESAEKLGLKVIRMWAFNDGDGWNALQPRIGQIDDHVLRYWRLCTATLLYLSEPFTARQPP